MKIKFKNTFPVKSINKFNRINSCYSPNFEIIHPKCEACMYSRIIPDFTLTPHEYKLTCALFRYGFVSDPPIEPYIETFICRNEINLCGNHGEYFKSKKFK